MPDTIHLGHEHWCGVHTTAGICTCQPNQRITKETDIVYASCYDCSQVIGTLLHAHVVLCPHCAARFKAMQRALHQIAEGTPPVIIDAAKEAGVEQATLDQYAGYKPRWRETAEARGAMFTMVRLIAKKALQ